MTLRYPVTKIVGSRIRKIRKSYGLTGTDLARHLNISQQQFSRYERGTNRIDIDSLVAIANFLKTSIHYFFEDISVAESTVHKTHNMSAFNSNLCPLTKVMTSNIIFKR
ncbi:helix-turn-helix domain-containing protein [Providencia sp.]|uniref:helix-turn-helix domain-containing protein n=1 Tax=Providencia sp. TaxID=589 RepID=UPI003F978E82